MGKVQLIINSINGCTWGGVAVIFNAENQYTSTEPIEYEEQMTNQEILNILGIEESVVYETLLGGRPPRRR